MLALLALLPILTVLVLMVGFRVSATRAMVYFPDIITACEAVVALKKGPVDGAELLDRLSLRSVENKEGIPAFIKDFDDSITAVLLETLAPDKETLKQNIVTIKEILTDFQTVRPVEFTAYPAEYGKLWDTRKGVFPAVGGTREIGTTCLIEDVANHLESLPAAARELQEIIAKHGYSDGVIYGHALKGTSTLLCAEKVILPPDVNCCGFAGDKGFSLPKLNEHGLRKAVSVVQREGAVAGYSNSRTCEIGCATYTGIPYMSIMYLVDETTKPGSA